MVLRKPKRRSMRAADAFITIEPAEDMKVIAPLAAADLPNPSCIISGIKNGSEPPAIRHKRAADDREAEGLNSHQR